MLISFNAYSYQSSCEDLTMPVSTYQTFLDSYEANYLKLKKESSDWQKIADVLFTLTLVVTILAATVSALQSLPDTAWKKWVVAIIGMLIAVTTYFKDMLPDGSHKSFQQAISKSKVIEEQIDQGLSLAKTPGLSKNDMELYIKFVCKHVKSLQELSVAHSTNLPPFLDIFIKPASASNHLPEWVSSSSKRGWIVSKGEGLSISEAKSKAEQDGYSKISNAIEHLIDESFSKPIFQSLGKEIQESLVKMVRIKEVFFDSSESSRTYWILYSFDEQAINGILSGITFPLTIFSTDLIAKNTETLKSKLTEFGFTVSISSSPRGPLTETNAIFVGEGVPVNAIKETVRILMDQGIPLKAIVYPWHFQRSSLPEIQKINHLQIGGSDIFEEWRELNQNDLDELNKILSQDDLIAYSKTPTDQLKAAWGLEVR